MVLDSLLKCNTEDTWASGHLRGLSVMMLTSLAAMASIWYERPKLGAKATSLTLSVTRLMVSTFNHFLKMMNIET